MKKISYLYGFEIDRGTKDAPRIETVMNQKSIVCADADFDANYAIAQREAVGEITVEDAPDPPPGEAEQLRADVDFILAMEGLL